MHWSGGILICTLGWVGAKRINTAADEGLLSLLDDEKAVRSEEKLQNAEEGIKKKHKHLERVKEIQDVKNIKKIKNLKKIKSIIPIDKDLALKMKKEIGQPDRDYSTEEISEELSESGYTLPLEDLIPKVNRLLRLFNVTDLDDIVKVTPINPVVAKIKLNDEGAEIHPYDKVDLDYDGNFPTDKELDKFLHEEISPDRILTSKLADSEIRNPRRRSFKSHAPPPLYDDKFEKENEQINKLDNEIHRDEKMILHDKQELQKEKEFMQILLKMLKMARDKVNMIEEVIAEHKGKEFDLQKAINKVQQFLKDAKVEKIEHLENLKSLAEEKKNEALSDIDYYSAQVDRGKSVLDESESGEEIKINRANPAQYVDRSKYNVFPLKSIKTMKKIISMLELTPDQAEKLKGWQEQRDLGDIKYEPEPLTPDEADFMEKWHEKRKRKRSRRNKAELE